MLYIVSPGLLNTDSIIQEQCGSYYLIKDNRPLAARDPLPGTTDKSNRNWMGKAVLVICLRLKSASDKMEYQRTSLN